MNVITSEWLKAAKDDIEVIRHIIQDDHLTHIVAFHAQQAIEKCFKAVLEENKISVPKIHDLLNLYERAGKFFHMDLDIEILREVNDLYIESRYPGEFGLLPNGKPTMEAAERLFTLSKDVYAIIESGL